MSRVQDNPDSVCVVCCRTVSIYAIAVCDHPVCHDCATRMRVLCKQSECAICRRDLPKVIFSRQRKPYSDVAGVVYTLQDRKHKILFEDESIQRTYWRLLEHSCRVCKTNPVFGTFAQLKDHVRREHELHFCDLCVKHLMIFSCERKLYTRSDLARHRRLGDPDDSSHRGHPLCEFCDERYLDNDELFRHLRKDHFFCHFCDANGMHHYYCDYEYLREHFRVEHFLCEEGECERERFTTVFNSEIDMKAHRASVHNKGMTKAQVKQARTLELEFTIAPRGMTMSAGAPVISSTLPNGRSGMDAEVNHRRARREEYTSMQSLGVAETAISRSDEQRSARAQRPNNDENRSRIPRRGYDDVPTLPLAAPNLDVSSRSDFPTLGGDGAPRKVESRRMNAPTASSSLPATPPNEHGGAAINSDSLARRLAKINRFTVGNAQMGVEDDFPALKPSKAPPQKSSQLSKPGLWASTGSATLSVTASQSRGAAAAAAAEAKRTRNTLTLKLNSQEEFPGLLAKGKGRQQQQRQTHPNVSIQLSHQRDQAEPKRVNPAPQSVNKKGTGNGKEETTRSGGGGSGGASSVHPLVTNMSSSQNITFVNQPAGASAKVRRRRSPTPPSDDDVGVDSRKKIVDGERAPFRESLPKTDDGWYVLKKSGKSTKLDSPPEECPTEFHAADPERDFPVLEKKGGRVLRSACPGTAPSTPAVWKKGNEEVGTATTTAAIDSPATPVASKTKSKKKKSTKAVVNGEEGINKVFCKEKTGNPPKGDNASSASLSNGNSNSKSADKEKPVGTKKSNASTSASKKSVKRTELNVGSLASPSEEQQPVILSPAVEILSSEDNFPSLLSSLKQVNAPPGFRETDPYPTVTKSLPAPPPGFSAQLPTTTKPPPGFKMVVGASPSSPTSVTFTSSSGRHYNAILTPPASPYSTYEPTDNFQTRSQELTTKLRAMLEGGSEDRFATFKLLSGLFRQGDASGADYYTQCVHLMGRDKFQSIFPELLVLLPDITKQHELLAAHKTSTSSTTKKGVDPFLICASCQQVLTGKDFRAHESSHNLIDNFPSLDDGLTQPTTSLSQVTWVKRS